MAATGIAIRDSRILRWVGVASAGLTIISGVTLVAHGAWGVATVAAVVTSLSLIKRRNSVAQIRLLANGGCELMRASSSQPDVATLDSSFEAFGLVILLFRGSFPTLLVLAPGSVETEPRRRLGLWLRSDADRANSVATPVS